MRRSMADYCAAAYTHSIGDVLIAFDVWNCTDEVAQHLRGRRDG
jgi:hypothetical protein